MVPPRNDARGVLKDSFRYNSNDVVGVSTKLGHSFKKLTNDRRDNNIIMV